MNQIQENEKSSIATNVKDLPEKPNLYDVVFYNDDYTPIDFVVAIFCKIFNHSEEKAMSLANKIHNEGQAVAGTYIKEIAKQKVSKSMSLSKQNGFPLQCELKLSKK